MSKREEYAVAIADAIMGLFRDEENGGNQNFHFNPHEIDATVFITSMVMGCNIVFGKLTQDDRNNLEFTYLLNQLVVQDMLEGSGGIDE